ncbi:hypothetical protein C6A77_05585 [Pseudomonas sp. AFG_SD02_1510_Pfu_092]|nr:hypothetical protein C6A77_05585 [Pseudomonas sp. AFG_SD02_1510_Pfu_092]
MAVWGRAMHDGSMIAEHSRDYLTLRSIDEVSPGPPRSPVGAGVPAKQATRWLAPALPVFAGMPAPTKIYDSLGT